MEKTDWLQEERSQSVLCGNLYYRYVSGRGVLFQFELDIGDH